MLIIQQLVNGLMLGGVYVMVAVAFTLIIGMLNFLNFTIPALYVFRRHDVGDHDRASALRQ